MRIFTANVTFNHRPFAGQGASLYATISLPMVYRNLRVINRKRHRRRGHIIHGGSGFDIGSTSVTKTNRVATVTHPTAQFSYAVPASFLPGPGLTQTVYFDVRHWKDDVENEVDNTRLASVVIDENGDQVLQILGTAQLLDQEQRAGGVVRLRFRYLPAIDGVQPTQMRAVRTAGPTSPADVVVSFSAGQQIVEIDTPALSDSSSYTYLLRAENGAVTKDLIASLIVVADATGPPAPTLVTTSTK